MKVEDILVALNIESALSIDQLLKKFNIEAEDNNKFSRLGDTLSQNIKRLLTPHLSRLLEKELKTIEKKQIKVITIFNEEYPSSLKNIFDPPAVLYIKGSLEKKDLCSLAVVGSRKASSKGLGFAKALSFSLARYGLTVVSGMALGIDSAAHQGALEARGRTLAILGSGFGYIYPVKNKRLAIEIAQKGAVVSEFSFFTKPSRLSFPRRNRIISGLSVGVVVIEATERSGSLITADFALEQGREVFAVPGFADSPTSKGTNKLIRQGATLVENELDILEALPQAVKDYLEKNRENF